MMKPLYPIMAALAFWLGCDSSDRKAAPQPYEDFESAIEAIATSDNIWEASAAAAQIYSGGIPAINTLRTYLDDDRVIPPSGFCSRSINSGNVTIGQQASWTIREMIEVNLPKVFDDSYYVLSASNLEHWLDERKEMSIIELKIEAAATQLDLAKQQTANGAPYAKDAVKMVEDRLIELRRTYHD